MNLYQEEIINQAFKFHSEGKIAEASKYYQYFIDQGFSDPKVFSNYGIILQNLGRLKEAESFYRKAIKINPNFANAYSNLGNVLRNLGILQEAELYTRKAIEIKPNFANAYLNLGSILRDLGNLQEAELYTRKAIKINPNFVNAHLNLGSIFKDLGKFQDAQISYRKAIELNPNFADANLNFGALLKDLGKFQEAEIFTRKAIELKPDFAEAYSNLGNILIYLEKFQEAEIFTRKAIELKPNCENSYFNLFRNYEEINNLEKLKETLKEFKDIDSIKNELFLFDARLNFRNNEHKIAKELIDNISPQWLEQITNNQKIIYWSYKAFIEDKVGNYDTAYFCFEKSQNDPYYKRFRKESYLNYIDSYKKSIINKKIIVSHFNDGIEDSNLVFLIGFPRSGTTLLDTILRSHADIEVIEEQPLIKTIEKLIHVNHNTKIENLYDISYDTKTILRRKYFELLRKYSNKKVSLKIDKMPLNTVPLPLITLLFPNAKIIFTHRHPYDTVLSCFQQHFKPNEAMANLVSLQSSSVIYDQVMNGWDLYQKNLPLNFITSKYERLIEDFDSQIIKILEFLGVEWDENIRHYRKTALGRGKINTPSFSQVVQPLYKSSIKKWKNYEKYFENCHQYLEKWVTYFDY